MHPTFHPNFVQFLKEFNVTFDYFECHELLEDYWKDVSPKKKTHPLTALILLSTSMYHWRRGNIKGAIKTMQGSIKRLEETFPSTYYETINFPKLQQDITHSIGLMLKKSTFENFTIDIIDDHLLLLVNELEIPSSEDIHFLTHKHMLRDRSEILNEREKQKKRRDDL